MGQGDKKPKPNNKAAVRQYMNRIAQAESGNRMFDDEGNIIKNTEKGATAKGPYQFTDGTWKAMEQKLGKKLKRDSWDDNVLAMEKLTEININRLEKEGIPVTDGNIYMLHFLGDSGGATFLKKLSKDPNALAQDLVSKDAVSYNKNVFTNKATGKPRTAAEVYNEMTGRLKPKTSGQPQQPRFQAFDQTETDDEVQLYEEAPVQTKESTNVNQGRGMRKDIAVPKMKISKAISSVDNQRQSLGLTEGVEFLDADTKLAFTEEQQAEGGVDNQEYAKYGGKQKGRLKKDNQGTASESTMVYKDKRIPEIVNKDLNTNIKRDKDGNVLILNEKGFYEKYQPKKQPEIVQGGKPRSGTQIAIENKQKQAEAKKKILKPLDVATDVMQLGNFIPHPIPQAIGKAGNIAGTAIDAYQTYDALSEGDYTNAGINSAGMLLPSFLGSKAFRRNSKYSSFAPTLNSILGNKGKTNYLYVGNQVRKQSPEQVWINRGMLGALGAETAGDVSFKEGGMLTEFNEGGTHEESELGGIPQGQSEDGQTNLVEEGETKLKDNNYVLSNSLIVNELDANELNLPKDIIGMTFADASKFLNKIAEENGSDHLIMKDVKANLENLTIANEKARVNQEKLITNQGYKTEENKMFLGGLTSAMSLAQTAFGKSGIDTSGKTDADAESISPGMMGLSSAAKGAQAGAMFGPLGAGIGGAVGLTAGLIGGFKAKKDALKAHQNFEIGQSNMKISNFNLGGTLNGDPKKKKETAKTLTTKENLQNQQIVLGGENPVEPTSDLKGKPVDIDWGVQTKDSKGNYVSGNYIYYKKRGAGYDPEIDREFVSNENWKTVQGTNQFRAYNIDVENERKAAEARRRSANTNPQGTIVGNNSFAGGGDLNFFKEEEHTKGAYGYSGNNFMKDQFLSNLNYAKNKASDVELSYISEDELKNDKSGYASNELTPSTDKKFKMKGESPLKYAGLVGAGLNYLEDSKLKAREVNLDKIDGKYQKQYADEASILNNVRNEMNSQVSSLSELGLSRGQLISNLNAAGLNKAKATSDAMQKAQDINRNENRTAQEFDNRNDIFNIGQSNQEKELTQREQDAVADRKRMSRDALFLSAGELGKEQTYKNRLYNLTGGYDTQGVFKAADGKQYIQNEQGILVAIPNQEEKKNGGLLGKYDKYLSNKKAEREMYINILKDN